MADPRIARALLAQSQGPIGVVPMPPGLLNDLNNPQSGAIDEYENLVDQYILANKLGAGSKFRVDHPEGPRFYETLPPDSGGRKNWRQIYFQQSAPTS